MRPLHPVFPWLMLALLVPAAGCTSGSGALSTSLWAEYSTGGPDDAQLQFQPGIDYLRASTKGRPGLAYLVLGYDEPHPEGTVQVWYSAQREVVKLQNGRIVGTAGLETDWQAVRLPRLPAWKDVPATGLQYRRELDLMPGYRYGRVQTLQLRPIPAPADVTLRWARSAQLQWFVEEQLGDPAAGKWPPARYAVNLAHADQPVVYSEQCLSPTLCLSLEPVPPVEPPPTPPASAQGGS